MIPIIPTPLDSRLSTSNHCPVLIVGPPRTASSFLVHALTEGAGFAGSSEGHITWLMCELDTLVAGYYRLARQQGLLAIPQNTIAKIPEYALRRALVRVFENYNDLLFGNPRWMDKTVNAEAIGALPYLLSIWPNAKIIYLKRDGIENVLSAEKYFRTGFREACLNWANCGEQWDRIRALLPVDAYVEIEHGDLLQEPRAIARRISQYLALPPHLADPFTAFIEEKTGEWRKTYTRRPPLADLGWPAERLFTFLSICGAQMQAQGYGSAEEIATTLRMCSPELVSLDPGSARILTVDAPEYFQISGDGFYIVPGRERAATVIFESIELSGMTRFEATLNVAHSNAQPVRFEFIAIDRSTGAVVFSRADELGTMESRDIASGIPHGITSVDLLIRVTRASTAVSNDYAWGKLSSMRFTAHAVRAHTTNSEPASPDSLFSESRPEF